MSHDKILKIGKMLGVQIVEMDVGLCNGITILRAESRLANNTEQFSAPLQKLLTGNVGVLYENLTKVKQKIEAKLPLLPTEKPFERVLQFYTATSAYQFPQRHRRLLKRHYNQQDYEVSQIIGCEAIKKAGGLASIYSELGIFDQDELVSFFKKLAKVIAKKNAEEMMSIIISSPLHVISLDPLPNKEWELFDINICNYTRESTTLETSQLYKTFKLIFPTEISESKNLLLKIDVVTTGDKKQQLSQEFTNFKRKFNLNDKLNTVEIEEMVVMAARSNNLALLQELIKKKVPLDKFIRDLAAAHYAATNGHVAIITELAKHNVKLLGITNSEGNTPAIVAAQEGHVAVLTELAKHDVKLLGIVNSAGTTPALIAAQQGHVAVLSELAKHDVKLLGIANNQGTTPAFIAAQNGHVAVLTELAKHDVKLLGIADNQGTTPALIAAQQGHVAVLTELAKHDVKLLGIVNSAGTTPALIATKKGHVAVLAELAKHDKNLLSHSSFQGTPASTAVLYNQVAVLQFLLEQGVDLITPLTTSKSIWISRLGADSKFLQTFHKDKEAGDAISISLQELALILGHEESIQFFNKNLSTNPETLSCAMKIYNDSKLTKEIQDNSPQITKPLATIGFYAAKSPKAIFDEGVAEFRQKNYQKALASLLEALEGFKRSSSTTAFQLARCYSTLASTQRELGYLDDAKTSCKEALIYANNIQDTKTKTEEIRLITTKLDGLEKQAGTAAQLK